MADYHFVCCGTLGIYAGTIMPNGLWQDASEVTIEAATAVAQYFLENKKVMLFDYEGEKYVLKVEKIKEESENE